MPQERRLLNYPMRAYRVPGPVDMIYHFYDIVEMALRIYPSRKGEPHQFMGSRNFGPIGRALAKHDAAEFNRANSAFDVERIDEADAGKGARPQMRTKGGGVYENGVTAGRPNDWSFERDER
jgi:hypothetical protein